MVRFVDSGGEQDQLAPVTPLFAPSAAAAPARERSERSERRRATEVDSGPRVLDREAAEGRLLKKLRARSLSVSEARSVLREVGASAEDVDGIIEDFERRRYLDDAALAEQLVHSAVDRKGQGRRAIAQTLAKRGVDRDVADRAIAELPDDDAERALEFARTKARSMRGLEHSVALRRLAGQLARRGYGSQSLSAARAALDEL